MVTGITDKVTIQEYYPQVEQQPQKTSVKNTDESGNPVIVSKDFILNLLSLAIGKPFFLEGKLGKKVDVKV